jgi:hypothetical protein
MIVSLRVNRRRYAGDFTLGARNYHSLARNEAGEDGATLIAEMAAYADDRVGACTVRDLVSASEARELGIEHREHCILLELGGTPGSNAALARLGTQTLWIPYRVERTCIEGVIDLRFLDVQNWFHAEFSDFQKHTMQKLEESKKPGAILPSLSHSERPASFYAMLPVLMDPARGGNTVTDHIGQWVRMHGANALIYPSARANVGVAWENGELRKSLGWNLVDYRGREGQVFGAITVLLGEDPWHSPHAARFDFQRRGASWVMVPQPTRFGSRVPVTDEDLRVRFKAGERVFGDLIALAEQHQRETEDGWLESLRRV